MHDHISIEITPDNTKAIVMLKPDPGVDISYDEIIQALQAAGVVHGHITERIKAIVEEKAYFRRFTAAVASPPIPGIEAKIEFLISEESAPLITEDGRVDYYNLQLYKSVQKGQPLIKKIPPTAGTPGMSIFGQPIPAPKGSDVNLQEYLGGVGAAVDPDDSNQLIALHSGIYNRLGKRVEVRNQLTINSDIDFSVGSIKVPVVLHINGDVKSGFELESDKDIFISGVIENAAVSAGGSLEVMKGIVKGGAAIKVNGKLTANYIVERDMIRAGEVDIKNTIIAAKIFAEKSVKAHKIVGGKIVVGRFLEVCELGNKNGDPTRIEVGVDAILLSRLRKLSKEVQILNKQKQETREFLVNAQFDYDEASEQLENTLFASKQSSPQIVKKLNERLQNAARKIEEHSSVISLIEMQTRDKMTEMEKIAPELAVENPVVKVTGIVYPNVTIKMGMVSEIRTNKEGKNLRFELSDDGKIVILPLNA